MDKFIPAFLKDTADLSEKRERIRFMLMLVFVFSLPFDMLYSNIALFLLILTTLLDFTIEKLKRIPKQAWIFQAVYFLSVIGYFYSHNLSNAGFLLERQLSILLVPILLTLAVEINEQRKKQLLTVFLASSVVTILFLFFNVLVVIRELQLPLSQMFTKEFFNHRFSAPLEIHAGYLSLYVAIGIIHAFQLIVETLSKKIRLLLLLCLMILFAGMLFLAARNMSIATLLIIGFVFPFFYIKKKLLYITSILIATAIGFIVINNVTYLKKRFVSELIGDIKSNQDPGNTDVIEPRIDRWKCALNLASNSPVFGYGTGDEIAMLKTEYIKNGLYISYLEEFNSHNEYLSYLLKNGIVGLLLFLGIFGYFIYLAISAKDYIYISFLILLLIGFFTENILDANKGIYFFAFFNTFFGYAILKVGKNKKSKASAGPTGNEPDPFV